MMDGPPFVASILEGGEDKANPIVTGGQLDTTASTAPTLTKPASTSLPIIVSSEYGVKKGDE